MKLKVTYDVDTKQGVAELLAATKHFNLCPMIGVTMDSDDVHEAFELLDLVSAEFTHDPKSVQCFDKTWIVDRVNDLAHKWNEEGRP